MNIIEYIENQINSNKKRKNDIKIEMAKLQAEDFSISDHISDLRDIKDKLEQEEVNCE